MTRPGKVADCACTQDRRGEMNLAYYALAIVTQHKCVEMAHAIEQSILASSVLLCVW